MDVEARRAHHRARLVEKFRLDSDEDQALLDSMVERAIETDKAREARTAEREAAQARFEADMEEINRKPDDAVKALKDPLVPLDDAEALAARKAERDVEAWANGELCDIGEVVRDELAKISAGLIQRGGRSRARATADARAAAEALAARKASDRRLAARTTPAAPAPEPEPEPERTPVEKLQERLERGAPRRSNAAAETRVRQARRLGRRKRI